ncbi:MAG: TIGR03808 family TAT-translocated repetitive protein [Rhizobiales bacterium]|nr:TIGR03808 family TAT-translocated repetitive protein [Hyphomicrobiales bacterium]
MWTRRAFLAGAGAVLAQPALARDRASELQGLIEAATSRREVVRLPAGVVATRGLTLPSGARLVGAKAGTTLRLVGEGPLLYARNADRIGIEGVALEGSRADGHDGGLVEMANVARLTIEACVIADAPRDGVRLTACGGRIANSTIRKVGRGGLFSLDSGGLLIENNLVEQCGDNGVQIWGSAQRADGSRVIGNRIRAIRNRSGGTGQYGNGLSIYRAGAVLAQKNRIADCAFSALRDNSGHGVRFLDNVCERSGETAIFAEFAYRDVAIERNLIDGAASGIQMVNFADHGGRGGVCVDNVIRGLHVYRDGEGKEWGYQCGVKVEAETLVARNRIDDAPWCGVLAGWGPSLKDVRIEDNVIRNAPIGVGASVAPGAGRASIRRNAFQGVRQGVVALRWDKAASGDLTREPNGFASLTVEANRAG